MNRRSVLADIFGGAFAGGISAVVGACALMIGSPYFIPMLTAGAGGVAIGLIGLLALLIFQQKEPPVSNNDDEMGDDNTLYGNVQPRRMGSRNTIVGPTHGTNTILPAGTSVGYGAGHDPTSVIIGAGAGAGLNRRKP
jgi:hypothetical protein